MSGAWRCVKRWSESNYVSESISATRVRTFPGSYLHTRKTRKYTKILLSTAAHTLISGAIHQVILFLFILLPYFLYCSRFLLFRDNSVLALHQFCVVSARGLGIIIFLSFRVPKRRRARRRRSVACLTFACAFCHGSPALFIFEFIVAEFRRRTRDRTDGYTCKLCVCEFISDTSHHSPEEVRWGGINFERKADRQVEETLFLLHTIHFVLREVIHAANVAVSTHSGAISNGTWLLIVIKCIERLCNELLRLLVSILIVEIRSKCIDFELSGGETLLSVSTGTSNQQPQTADTTFSSWLSLLTFCVCCFNSSPHHRIPPAPPVQIVGVSFLRAGKVGCFHGNFPVALLRVCTKRFRNLGDFKARILSDSKVYKHEI